MLTYVFQQVKEQQTFLDESLSLWSKFQSQCGVFEDWLSRTEELVTRDSYGYTLKETEAYCNSIKVYIQNQNNMQPLDWSFSVHFSHMTRSTACCSYNNMLDSNALLTCMFDDLFRISGDDQYRSSLNGHPLL